MPTNNRGNMVSFNHVQVCPSLIAVSFGVGLFLYLEVV